MNKIRPRASELGAVERGVLEVGAVELRVLIA
jgi:hypothetical protein